MDAIKRCVAQLRRRAVDPKVKVFGLADELAALADALEAIDARLASSQSAADTEEVTDG